MKPFLTALLLIFCIAGAAAEKPTAKFAWGADAGASIDMSGEDMSTVDITAAFGMSRGWVNFLGIGAAANVMVSNSCRSYPVFVNFRTNFSNSPSPAFWDIRAGLSLNYLEHNHQQTGFYGSTGVGINLARSSKFCSHIILEYTFRERRTIVGEEMTHNFRNLNYASVRIGVMF